MDALTARGAKLLRVELETPRALIGKSTVEAIRSGVVYGYAGMVDGILRPAARRAGRGHGHDRHRRAGRLRGAALRAGRRDRRPADAPGPPADLGAQLSAPNLWAVRSLHDSWELGGVTIPNRVVLAPLAGIGNWFVRLQAKRYGAGPGGVRDGLLVRDPLREPQDARRAADGSTRASARAGRWRSSSSGRTRRSCARPPRTWRGSGADLIDLNMGCPVPKVMKTGAGAALLSDPDTAVAVARAARRGLGVAGDREAARRGGGGGSAAGVGGRRGGDHLPSAHDQGAAQGDAGLRPRARSLVESLPVPVIVTGGMDDPDHVRWVFEYTGCEAVMLARGSLGNPWLFSQVLGLRDVGADGRRDRGGMALGARSRRGASGRRSRRPLPAEVPSVVRGAARCPARRAGRASARSDAC